MPFNPKDYVVKNPWDTDLPCADGEDPSLSPFVQSDQGGPCPKKDDGFLVRLLRFRW